MHWARISLDRTQMQIDDSLVNLGMGMAVTVEIRPASQRAQLSALADPPDDRRKGFDTRELKQAIEY